MNRQFCRSGAQVAWTMLDGNTMTGRVETLYGDRVNITRVDGGQCQVDIGKLRLAVREDVQASVEFFQNIGKG